MALETKFFNVQDYLKTPKDQAEYFQVALESGDPEGIATAIGDIARARGASSFSRESGVGRQTIYKQFRKGGNPRLATVKKALDALGLRLTVAPKV